MTQLLDEDRISRMRATVLAAAADDVRRRAEHARRVRRSLAFAGVAATVVVLGGLAVGHLHGGGGGGGGGASSSAAAGSSADSATLAGQAPAPPPAGGPVNGMDTFANSPGAPSSSDDSDRDVIVTGSASVTVGDARAVADRLSSWVEARGGRVDDRKVTERAGEVHASLTVRVPAVEVVATLDNLASYGDLTRSQTTKNDVTGAAKDLDARIKALRISIARLEGILDRATVTGDVIKTESALTDRQSQVEQLVSQRSQMAGRVELATLTVTLSPHAPRPHAKAVEPGGFRGGLRHGWNALVTVVNHGVTAAGVLLPWLGLLAVLVLAYAGLRAATGRRCHGR